MRLANVAALIAVLALAAPASAPAQVTPLAPLPSVTLPPAVDRVLRDYERAWAAGDEAALANLFTEDGFVLQNGRAAVRGRAAIREAYADGSGPLRLRAIGYATSGSVGYILGAYAYGESAEVGKFTLALRRAPGGRWMIASDMDNMNQMPRRPPPPPAAPAPR